MDLGEQGYDTDKGPAYMARYDRAFAALRDRPVALLELGVLRGGSLLMWADYFPHGTVVGLDINPVQVDHARVRVYQGGQQDAALLATIAAECAPDGFDVIIDDAGHLGSLSAASFLALYDRYLKPGGVYVLEDWGTGYWDTWLDGAPSRTVVGKPAPRPFVRLVHRSIGLLLRVLRPVPRAQRLLAPARRRTSAVMEKTRYRSHDAGMVGLVKQLVDLTSRSRDPREGDSPPPAVAEMWISDGQAFCFKPL